MESGDRLTNASGRGARTRTSSLLNRESAESGCGHWVGPSMACPASSWLRRLVGMGAVQQVQAADEDPTPHTSLTGTHPACRAESSQWSSHWRGSRCARIASSRAGPELYARSPLPRAGSSSAPPAIRAQAGGDSRAIFSVRVPDIDSGDSPTGPPCGAQSVVRGRRRIARPRLDPPLPGLRFQVLQREDNVPLPHFRQHAVLGILLSIELVADVGA